MDLSRPIPASTRRAVIERDGYECQHCGRHVIRAEAGSYQPNYLHIDHLTEWAAGGSHQLENLVVSCADCNLRRPRPAKDRIVRHAHVRPRVVSGRHYWPKGFMPPLVVDWHPGFEPVDLAAERLAMPAGWLINRAARGRLTAAAQPMIRIVPPDYRAPSPLPRRRAR